MACFHHHPLPFPWLEYSLLDCKVFKRDWLWEHGKNVCIPSIYYVGPTHHTFFQVQFFFLFEVAFKRTRAILVYGMKLQNISALPSLLKKPLQGPLLCRSDCGLLQNFRLLDLKYQLMTCWQKQEKTLQFFVRKGNKSNSILREHWKIFIWDYVGNSFKRFDKAPSLQHVIFEFWSHRFLRSVF